MACLQKAPVAIVTFQFYLHFINIENLVEFATTKDAIYRNDSVIGLDSNKQNIPFTNKQAMPMEKD